MVVVNSPMTAHFMFQAESTFFNSIKMLYTVSQCAVQENEITCDEMDFMFKTLSRTRVQKTLNLDLQTTAGQL